MRCAICDADDDTVTPFNTDCRTCQTIISDTLHSYDTHPEELLEEFDD